MTKTTNRRSVSPATTDASDRGAGWGGGAEQVGWDLPRAEPPVLQAATANGTPAAPSPAATRATSAVIASTSSGRFSRNAFAFARP
jgi:hypothetical protein